MLIAWEVCHNYVRRIVEVSGSTFKFGISNVGHQQVRVREMVFVQVLLNHRHTTNQLS